MNPLASHLLAWYKKNSRDLPWRHTQDPYKIWISEIMLQQTTVATVIPYYERWVKEFPIISDVAKADIQKILKMWQGLGYYNRAKNIHKTAQIICKDYIGKIPQDKKSLLSLPGFGPYTAGAVLSIAFDQREPIIDANVRRVVMRLIGKKGVADTTQDKEILKFLDKVMPQKGNNIFNQALMEIGALVCRSQNPQCSNCPLTKHCTAYKLGLQTEIPITKNKVIKNIEASIAIIKYRKKYLFQKRPNNGLLADLWELPGGKIEDGENPEQALQRELKEELGCTVISQMKLLTVSHFYTEFKVKLHAFSCRLDKYPQNQNNRKWLAKEEFDQYPMPAGTVKVINKTLR